MNLNGHAVPDGAKHQESLDSELAGALESYLAAIEQGHPVDLERLAAQHPKIAEEFRACLGVLRLASQVERNEEADFSGHTELEHQQGLPNLLGDFRILRAIGRGGMGIVYEAEQLSLHRRVALKVLPFAAALDPQLMQRFKTEAQAAARLHHTNIVPVFSVGCERGVHYYAMQLIEGQTLAALISDLRKLEGQEPTNCTPTTTAALSLADDLISGRLEAGSPVSRTP